VPNEFNPRNGRHIDQVQRVLATMSQEGSGPDFRPANVRFREDGAMVLIDFSENPGVQGAQDDEYFAGLMKEFIKEFAGTDQELFETLCLRMSPQFREKIRDARETYLQ